MRILSCNFKYCISSYFLWYEISYSPDLGHLNVAGKETNAFLNDNWKEVYAVTSQSLTEAIVQAMETIMNRVSAVVPFEDAFPQTLP
jgi:hypothetical protein